MTSIGRRAIDTAVCVAVLMISTFNTGGPIAQAPTIFPRPGTVGVALIVAQVGALWFRRRAPRQVWAVVIAALIAGLGWFALIDGSSTPSRLLLAVVPAAYSVAVFENRRAGVIAASIGAALTVFTLMTATPATVNEPALYALVAWVLGAAALGDAVRSNRELIASTQERALRAEQTREVEAARRVAEERLRISRELHDVVAHQLAAVSVHAGVAEHLVTSDPARAATALAQVRDSAATALREMRSMVGLLRTGPDGAAEVAAPPRLSQLPELVAALGQEFEGQARAIRWDRTGPEPTLDESAELNIFRIVQESLTNAVKHGVGPIELLSGPSPEGFRFRVRNSTRPGATSSVTDAQASGGGHGLVGMRERAALIGAQLQAGPDGDSAYVVELVLP